MTEKKDTINVAASVTSIIGSRDVVRILKECIVVSSEKVINLDFQDVEFISRSAAHELLIMKEDLKWKSTNSKDVIFINTNKDVTDMLRTVAASRAVPVERPKFESETVDINSL